MADKDDNEEPSSPGDSVPPEKKLPEMESPNANNGEENGEEEEDQHELPMGRRGTALGSGPGKVIAFGALGLLAAIFVLYSLFFSKPAPPGPKPGSSATNPVKDVASPPPNM